MIWLVAGLLVLLARPLLAQPSARAVGQRIVGHLYEIVVYRDVPRQMGRVLLRIFAESGRLVRALLVPCLVLLIPTGLALVILASSQSVRPLQVGETTILTVTLNQPRQHITLLLPPEIAQDSVPLEIGDRLQIVWRLKALAPGRFEITLQPAQGEPLKKSVSIDGGDSAWDLNAIKTLSEKSLPSKSWARKVTVDCPPRTFWVGTSEFGWLAIFGLALMAWGIALELVLSLSKAFRRQ